MIPDAEQELKEKAQKIADQRKKDDGTYYTTLRSEWVNEDKLKRFFEFGQKINLVNKAFLRMVVKAVFSDGSLTLTFHGILRYILLGKVCPTLALMMWKRNWSRLRIKGILMLEAEEVAYM